MAGQYLLDLQGREGDAADHFEVVGAAAVREGAVLAPHHPVTGVEPALDEGAGGFLGEPEVAAGDRGPADPQFAGDPVRYGCAVAVADLGLEAGDGPADGAGLVEEVALVAMAWPASVEPSWS